MDVEDMKKRIKYSKNIEEIDKIRVEKGKTIGYYKNAKGEKVFTVDSEGDFDDLKRTVDETRLLLEIREDKIHNNHIREDAEATSLGSSNYYDLDSFKEKEETPEERKERRNKERARRKVQREGDKRDLKNHAKAQKKEKRMKERANKNGNKKLKNRIIAILLTGVAITSAGQGIAVAQANAREYNETAASLKGMDANEIYDKAEKEFKTKIAQAEGVSPEEVTYSVKQVNSSMEIVELEAGNRKYKYTKDPRGGISSGDFDGNISYTIELLNNRKDDLRTSIDTFKRVKNTNISSKDGKIVNKKEIDKGTTASKGTQDMDDYTL